VPFAFRGADLGDVDVEVADRVALEGLLGRLVASHLRQPADAVAHETPVQRGAAEMRDRCLQGVEAVVERQQGVPAEGDHHRFLFGRQYRRVRRLRTHRRIVHEGPLAPLGHRLVVEPVLRR